MTNKLRTRIPHIKDLDHQSLLDLTTSGVIKGAATEKTDGMAFEVGHDQDGFYSRTANSQKMRKAGQYEAQAKTKFGKFFNPAISKSFDDVHRHLHNNNRLVDHLKKVATDTEKDTSMKGEVFYKPNGIAAEKEGEVRFVGTAYDTKKMGSKGTFVVHSRVPTNKHHDVANISRLGDDNFKLDHDGVGRGVNVPVHDIHAQARNIDPMLMKSRRKADQPAKEKEKAKYDFLKKTLHDRIKGHLTPYTPKWGSETEGHVIHPSSGKPFKMVDDRFAERKIRNVQFMKKD